MPRLPVVSGEDIIKYLYRSRGFRTIRSKGSHVILRSADGRTVLVPLHDELDRGTLSNILERAGIDTDEFIEEWNK